jgi:multimeric flavodoxin WrbA
MAEGVMEGASSLPGVDAELHEIVPGDFEGSVWSAPAILESLDSCDAIVFGSPTHMGCLSTPLKSFFDATLERWYPRAWKDKMAAGFTSSASPSGDKLNALTDMIFFALQHGMIWVGMERIALNHEGINRLSVFLGAAGQGVYDSPEVSLHDGDRATAVELGARVARTTHALVTGRRG